MTTATQIIGRSLRLLGVLDPGEAMDADAAQDALDSLNNMLAEWYEAGVGLPEYSFSSLTNSLATDAADADAISYQLAIRLAPEYGIVLPQELVMVAQRSFFRLRSRYFQPSSPVSSVYY